MVSVFVRAGFHVISSDLQAPANGMSGISFVSADLQQTVEDEVNAQHVFAKLRHALGGRPLKALINNAAVQVLGKTEQLNRQDWRNTMDVNLLAPFFWSQALLPELEAAKGCVINISSIHARLTKRNFVAYATSKAALSGMTRALAVDLGPRVRVNAIEPAAIETKMLKTGFEGKPELYRQLESCHPQQRIGQPEEVAELALAIAEGRMNFLHGACIGLDGGIGNCLFDPD